jgi:hypothetical protein
MANAACIKSMRRMIQIHLPAQENQFHHDADTDTQHAHHDQHDLLRHHLNLESVKSTQLINRARPLEAPADFCMINPPLPQKTAHNADAIPLAGKN